MTALEPDGPFCLGVKCNQESWKDHLGQQHALLTLTQTLDPKTIQDNWSDSGTAL